MSLAIKTKPGISQGHSPRLEGVPRRYEETKPVQVQGHAHKKIIDIGQEIHARCESLSLQDKTQAIVDAEKEVWKQAEHMKGIALEKCRADCQAEKEQAIRELKAGHERTLKEEALRIEGEMTKVQQQEVKKEKEAGEKILRETVDVVKASKDQEREEAVAKARQEEITKARVAAEHVAKETAEREAATAKWTAGDKASALQALTKAKNEERIAAVLAAQQEERRIAAAELCKVRASHAEEIQRLRLEIGQWQGKVDETRAEVTREEEEKESWISKYEQMKQSYQEFIDKTTGFRPGQAEFLLK